MWLEVTLSRWQESAGPTLKIDSPRLAIGILYRGVGGHVFCEGREQVSDMRLLRCSD